MLEYITLICAILYLLISLNGYVKAKSEEYLTWLISSIAFLIIAIALVIMGLSALSLPYTIYLGSIYPSFLALGILIHKKTQWKYYLYFIVIMLALIAVGQLTGTILKIIAQVTLHALSGIIIVFLPLLEVLSNRWQNSYLLFTVGGVVIGIGGLALASITAGKPILPLEIVVLLLHPLLFLSVLLISLGIFFITKE